MADDAPPPPEPTPALKRRRRWRGLSVRGLMLLVLVVGGLIGWEAHRVDRIRRAVATLQREIEGLPAEANRLVPLRVKLHGDADKSRVRVIFDDEQAVGRLVMPRVMRRPGWQRWARRLVGEDHFRRVVAVTFDRRPTPEDWDAVRALDSIDRLSVGTTHATDDDLARLPDCAGLRHLSLHGSPITDKTLAVVGRLAGLRSLDIGRTHTSNDGLAHLAGLADLDELTLRDDIEADAGLVHLRDRAGLRSLTMGRTTDEGLRRIAGNRRLEALSFKAQHVTDAGWAVVVGFPGLKELSIQDGHSKVSWDRRTNSIQEEELVKLTPAALRSLGQLARLERLTLGRFADDAWLAQVGRLAQLRQLTLVGDKVTDAGMAAIGGLPSLENLSILGSGLTDDGMAPIGRLPNLKTLSIFGGAITDAGAKHLAPAGRLMSLTLFAQVSDEAIADLRTAIPKLRFVHNTRQPARVPRRPLTNRAK